MNSALSRPGLGAACRKTGRCPECGEVHLARRQWHVLTNGMWYRALDNEIQTRSGHRAKNCGDGRLGQAAVVSAQRTACVESTVATVDCCVHTRR